jgi:hypothetical protein
VQLYPLWTAISRLQRAFSMGGSIALSRAVDNLVTSDPERAAKVVEASSPREASLILNDEIPELGTDDDVDGWIRDLELLAGGAGIGRQPSWTSVTLDRKTLRQAP